MGLNNVSALKEFLARVTAAPGTSGETPKVVMLDNLHRVSKLDDVFEVCGHNADQVSQYGAISNRIAPSTNAKSNYKQFYALINTTNYLFSSSLGRTTTRKRLAQPRLVLLKLDSSNPQRHLSLAPITSGNPYAFAFLLTNLSFFNF